MGERRDLTAEQLLVHAGWLRGLALRIVRDGDVADDLVQETWVAALRRAPATDEPVRPWLAKVLLNALRMRARGEGRRTAREQATLLLADEVPTPDVLVARAEAQRTLVDLVLRLDEPYRSTVLLHFCEGVALADIARAHHLPASTVRWRLKAALGQLRAWLDAEPGGRKAWALLACPEGVLVANKTSKLAAVLIGLALLASGVVFVLVRERAERAGAVPAAGAAIERRADASPSASAAGEGELGARASTGEAPPAWLAQPGAARRRIAGRVTFHGAPVAGATVELASLASESGLVAAPRRVTGADGTFDLGPRLAMAWSVRATAPGRAGAAVDVDLRDPRAQPDRLELALGTCDTAMVGTVRDASGGPIAGARITSITPDVAFGFAVETDARGAYELCVEPRWPGMVGVEVSAAGYGAIIVNSLVLGRTTVDVALVPEAVIAGRVVRDDTGEPVALAHVFVRPVAAGPEGTAARGAFTDDDGRFRLDGVAPGRRVVVARAAGLAPAWPEIAVVVEAGQTSREVELRLVAGATVRGLVRADGRPIAGARVGLVTADGAAAGWGAISQADGTFVLDAVPRGELRFIAIPYEVVAPTRIRVDRAAHDVVVEVEPRGALVGRVTRRGRPVAGAHLDLDGPNAMEVGIVRTRPDGTFEARGLRPGPWLVFASSEREGAFGRAPRTIQLARGATEQLEIDLIHGAAIAGTVVDQRGAPVAGVTVGFQHASTDDGGFAITAPDGTFRATTMTGGGAYRPSVRAGRLESAPLRPAHGREHPPVLLADSDAEVTGVVLAVQLDRLAIAGHVVDATGAPVADARVTAVLVAPGEEPRFSRWAQHDTVITDVDGRFSLTDLAAGTYAVRASASAGSEVTLTVPAGRTGLALVLPAPGAIEGTLVGFATTPAVTATRAGTAVPATTTGTSFSLRELAPGRYAITARTATEVASAELDVAPSRVSRVTLTSSGTTRITGRVREHRTGAPVEGMTCHAVPRLVADPDGPPPPGGARTDPSGVFVIPAAPSGDIVITCDGLRRLYSNGLRVVRADPTSPLEIDVAVVAWLPGATYTLAGFGAELDRRSLVPRLINVNPSGPAAAAGLRTGDTILAVDGTPVTHLSWMGASILIANRPPNSRVTLTVSRASTFTTTLTL